MQVGPLKNNDYKLEFFNFTPIKNLLLPHLIQNLTAIVVDYMGYDAKDVDAFLANSALEVSKLYKKIQNASYLKVTCTFDTVEFTFERKVEGPTINYTGGAKPRESDLAMFASFFSSEPKNSLSTSSMKGAQFQQLNSALVQHGVTINKTQISLKGDALKDRASNNIKGKKENMSFQLFGDN